MANSAAAVSFVTSFEGQLRSPTFPDVTINTRQHRSLPTVVIPLLQSFPLIALPLFFHAEFLFQAVPPAEQRFRADLWLTTFSRQNNWAIKSRVGIADTPAIFGVVR